MSEQKKVCKTQTIKIAAIRSHFIIVYEDGFEDKDAGGFTVADEELLRPPEIHLDISYPLPITNIVHEVTHAVRYELGVRKGFISLDDWSDEVLPYILAYIVGKILNYCEKHKIETIID
jgi:hypothetical protein